MKKIHLKRTKDLTEYINDVHLKYCDDELYKYYFASDWLTKHEDTDGWDKDALGIYGIEKFEGVEKKFIKRIGFIGVSIDRNHEYISNISLMLEKDYIRKGHGKRAFDTILEYLLIKRGFRKVQFTIDAENKRMLNIADGNISVRKVGILKNELKLRDGGYHDTYLFEAMTSNRLASNWLASTESAKVENPVGCEIRPCFGCLHTHCKDRPVFSNKKSLAPFE